MKAQREILRCFSDYCLLKLEKPRRKDLPPLFEEVASYVRPEYKPSAEALRSGNPDAWLSLDKLPPLNWMQGNPLFRHDIHAEAYTPGRERIEGKLVFGSDHNGMGYGIFEPDRRDLIEAEDFYRQPLLVRLIRGGNYAEMFVAADTDPLKGYEFELRCLLLQGRLDAEIEEMRAAAEWKPEYKHLQL